MAQYVYPVDVADFVARAKRRGSAFERAAGLAEVAREDEKLTAILWNASLGWFPVTHDRKWHGAIDIGLPQTPNDTYEGTEVVAVGDGIVEVVERFVWSDEGFVLGRVIIRHDAPSGEPFYVQYRHLDPIDIHERQPVTAGDPLGKIGWHGDFPHVEVAVASRHRLGGATDLVPECAQRDLRRIDGIWNVLRVKVDALDPNAWPVSGLALAEGFLFNPIEVIRWCRGDPYRHDIGPGSLHGLDSVRRVHSSPLAPGSSISVSVPTVFRSTPLHSCAALTALAHDPTFTPIAKGHSDPEAVKALQEAFALGHYDVGPHGPGHTGIHGEFDETLERIVQHFQRTKLKELIDKSGGIIAKAVKTVRTDGKVDWVTLLGLDMLASAHRDKPPSPPAPSTAAAPARPQEPPLPPAPLGNTIDASRGTTGLSIHFGMRMYHALLQWLWAGIWDANKAESDDGYRGDPKGVGYSTTNKFHYGPASAVAANMAVLDKEYGNEWPDIGIADARARDKKGDVSRTVGTNPPYPVYSCFGASWVGTGFTNCCNSQLAALTVALIGKDSGVKGGTAFCVKGGTAFGVKRDTPMTYDICKCTQKVAVGYYDVVWEPEIDPKTNKAAIDPKTKRPKMKPVMGKDGQKKQDFFSDERSVLLVFESTFVSARCFFKNKDKDKPILGDAYGGMIYAVEEFGIGEHLFSLAGTDQIQANYLKIRLGDLGTTKGHAWLVGDVRYGVWVDGHKGARPDYIVDQSTFVGPGAIGTFIPVSGKVSLDKIDGRTQAQKEEAKRDPNDPEYESLTKAQCKWLWNAANEKKFMGAVDAFVAKKLGDSIAIPGTTDRTIQKIEVLYLRQLSANGLWNTAHSVEFAGMPPGKDKMFKRPPYEVDKSAASQYAKNGITRPWKALPDMTSEKPNTIAVGRLYGPPPPGTPAP